MSPRTVPALPGRSPKLVSDFPASPIPLHQILPFSRFFPPQIRRIVSAEGEQGVPIPSLRRSGSPRGHRQHTKHQEHVGERQRVLLAWRRRRSVQGKRRWRRWEEGRRLHWLLTSADLWATFPTGSSRDEDGRGRTHQRVAQQNPRERQNVRGAAIGGWLTLMLIHSRLWSDGRRVALFSSVESVSELLLNLCPSQAELSPVWRHLVAVKHANAIAALL